MNGQALSTLKIKSYSLVRNIKAQKTALNRAKHNKTKQNLKKTFKEANFSLLCLQHLQSNKSITICAKALYKAKYLHIVILLLL